MNFFFRWPSWSPTASMAGMVPTWIYSVTSILLSNSRNPIQLLSKGKHGWSVDWSTEDILASELTATCCSRTKSWNRVPWQHLESRYRMLSSPQGNMRLLWNQGKVLGFHVCHRRIFSSRKWNRWMHPSPITYNRAVTQFHHWPLLSGVGNTITFLLTLLREDLLTSGINSSLSSYHHLWIEGTKGCLSCLLLHLWSQVCPQSKVIAILMISVIARAPYLLDVRESSEWM